MAKRVRLDSDYEDSSDEEIGPCRLGNLTKKATKKFTSLAVIDLDQTLIDRKYTLYDGADSFLGELNKLGYYILLWTAGDDNHVKTFYKDYPICKVYINDYITGLVEGHKPVSVARRKVHSKIHSYLGVNIFIDDNLGNIAKSDYDFKFCVLDFTDIKGNLDFVKLLSSIKRVK